MMPQRDRYFIYHPAIMFEMAQKKYQHHLALKAITSPNQVIDQLHKLDPILRDSNLQQMGSFNDAYIIVTRRIQQANLAGMFEYPDLMSQLETSFAHEYFLAFNNYQANGSLPSAWARLNPSRWHSLYPAWLSLMLGANAHINQDLIQALRHTIKDRRAFEADYYKVDKILQQSGSEILDGLELGITNGVLRKVFTRPVIAMILWWRHRVWHRFQAAQG